MGVMQGFRDHVLSLTRAYPRLARGGLNILQLKDLAIRVARRKGFGVDIAFAPWPWPATIQRADNMLFITVDSRRHSADQAMAFAHEVGHIVLDHLHAEPFWTDVDGPLQREEDELADLFAAIVLDKHRTPLEYLGIEQLELL